MILELLWINSMHGVTPTAPEIATGRANKNAGHACKAGLPLDGKENLGDADGFQQQFGIFIHALTFAKCSCFEKLQPSGYHRKKETRGTNAPRA